MGEGIFGLGLDVIMRAVVQGCYRGPSPRPPHTCIMFQTLGGGSVPGHRTACPSRPPPLDSRQF